MVVIKHLLALPIRILFRFILFSLVTLLMIDLGWVSDFYMRDWVQLVIRTTLNFIRFFLIKQQTIIIKHTAL